MNKEQNSAVKLRMVNMRIGVRNSSSAMIGAKMTMLLETMLQMPIDVTPKRVGNIFGCAMYMELLLAQFPPRAQITRKRNVRPGSLTSIIVMSMVPAMVMSAKVAMKTA